MAFNPLSQGVDKRFAPKKIKEVDEKEVKLT